MAKRITSYTVQEGDSWYTGNPPSGAKSSSVWTVDIQDANNQAITVTGDTFTLNYPTIYVVRGGSTLKKSGTANFKSVLKYGSSTLWTLHQRSPQNIDKNWNGSMSAGTQIQVYRRSDVSDAAKTVNTSTYFNQNNSTTKTISFTWTTYLEAGDLASPSYMKSAGLYSRAYSSGDYECVHATLSTKTTSWSTSVTLNAPPTFSSTNVSFNESYHVAGHTTASVTISSLSAKYGGTIKSAVLKIGNQTASRTSNGTLSIACSTAGTFTPTVIVTDSRGQVTTKSLSAITINSHTAPTGSSTQVLLSPTSYAGTGLSCSGSVTISGLTAYQGASISSAVLTIGSKMASRSSNGLITIDNLVAGSYTPTVKITDSWGGTKTITLDSITVNVYIAPSVSTLVGRTNSSGIAEDEGTSAVITAKFTYTPITNYNTLVAPTVSAREIGGSVLSGLTTTWYTDRSLNTAVTWSSVQKGTTLYGLITDSDSSTDTPFNPNKSYEITVIPEDLIGNTGVEITSKIGTAYYTVDFKAGGHGIAFGQASVSDGFYCNMDAHFRSMAGFIQMYGGNYTPPAGWLFCDGKTYNIADYPILASVIGNIYGGDGTTTFAVPDMRGRVPVGTNNNDLPNGANSSLSTRNRGNGGGSEYIQEHAHDFTQPVPKIPKDAITTESTSVAHTHGPDGATYHLVTNASAVGRRTIKNGTGTSYADNIYTTDGAIVRKTATGGMSANANHTHKLPNADYSLSNRTTDGAVNGVQTTSHTTMSTGSSGNMQPFRCVQFIICTGQ